MIYRTNTPPDGDMGPPPDGEAKIIKAKLRELNKQSGARQDAFNFAVAAIACSIMAMAFAVWDNYNNCIAIIMVFAIPGSVCIPVALICHNAWRKERQENYIRLREQVTTPAQDFRRAFPIHPR